MKRKDIKIDKIAKIIYKNSHNEISYLIVNIAVPYSILKKRDNAYLSKHKETISHSFKNNDIAISIINNMLEQKKQNKTNPFRKSGIFLIHKETKDVFLPCYMVKKVVIEKQQYKDRKKSSLTMLKEQITYSYTKAWRWRMLNIKNILHVTSC